MCVCVRVCGWCGCGWLNVRMRSASGGLGVLGTGIGPRYECCTDKVGGQKHSGLECLVYLAVKVLVGFNES